MPRGIKTLTRQVQIATVAPNRDCLAPPSPCDGNHIHAFGIVDIDHRGTVFRQHAREQTGLGVEIGVEGLVIVQVVLGEIREPRRLERHTVQPALVEPVTRGLHRGVSDAVGGGLCQSAVQGDRFGCGMGQRRRPCALYTGGAKVDGGQSHFDPDLPYKGADRGFPIGARDGDHNLGLCTEP